MQLYVTLVHVFLKREINALIFKRLEMPESILMSANKVDRKQYSTFRTNNRFTITNDGKTATHSSGQLSTPATLTKRHIAITITDTLMVVIALCRCDPVTL